jgi:hypothetical protein
VQAVSGLDTTERNEVVDYLEVLRHHPDAVETRPEIVLLFRLPFPGRHYS